MVFAPVQCVTKDPRDLSMLPGDGWNPLDRLARSLRRSSMKRPESRIEAVNASPSITECRYMDEARLEDLFDHSNTVVFSFVSYGVSGYDIRTHSPVLIALWSQHDLRKRRRCKRAPHRASRVAYTLRILLPWIIC
jgi:hypothetical protein